MTYRTPKFDILMSSDHAAQGLLFRDDNGLVAVDNLAEEADSELVQSAETRHKCEVNRLRSARLAVIEHAVLKYARRHYPALAQYPSVAKDVAEYLLPRLEEYWEIPKSENL